MFSEDYQLEAVSRNAVANSEVSNPFGGSLVNSSSVGTAQVVSRELAEMQAQIYLAKQFPRDQRRSTEQILTACQRPGLAAVAVYSYARGGTAISGPSIRLAEEIARDWGNLECGWNELERKEDSSIVRAFAWDKESNVLKTLNFYVPHYRSTKQGRKRITEERDLYELLANQAARRMRNCILALIPGDVVEAAVEQCERTLVTHCEITPDSIKKLLGTFEAFGVTKQQIEKRIQRNIESITPAQFVRMREIYTSLKDGVSEPGDWFDDLEVPEPNATGATEALKEKLGASKKPGRPRKQATEPAPEPADDPAPIIETVETPLSVFRFTILQAKDADALRNIAEEVSNAPDLTDSEREQLLHLIDECAIDFE